MQSIPQPSCTTLLLVLALLAILAYLPTPTQPLLEDDFLNIGQAQLYGPLSGWPQMAADAVFRLRATSYWFMYALNAVFGMYAPPYYIANILLHILNTWLVFALGCWRPLGYRLTAWAAAFFAVYEGHQEAVMWFSACNELLQFFFGVTALLCWICFLEKERWRWYAASLLSFVFAQISKESAVIVLPLLMLPLLYRKDRWRKAALLVPFAALAALSVWSVILSRTYSFRFQDGSFSLHAPFWLTWSNSYARLFWFWGLLSVVALAAWKRRGFPWVAFAWIAISLVPYSFLIYMHRIPSRQTYLASAGLACVVGAGILALRERFPASRIVVPAVLVILLVHNAGYLWTRKRAQYLKRAEPTERLIELSRKIKGPIYVRCFPRPREIAEEAVRLATGRGPDQLIFNAAEARSRGAAATFCYQEK